MKNFTKPEATAEEAAFKAALELINPHLYSVEERIREQSREFDPAVEGYIAYACGSSGKRLRPAMALLAGGATGKIISGHVDLAVIIELIHLATLVHDDIMDGAELRRDQPTANAKWGNALSVLLGDCLFAHALRLATGFSNTEVCRRIADAAAEVCSGEIIQTQRRFDLKLTIADYQKMIEMKTAALFSAACELGAFISEANPEVISSFKRFGRKFGTAYQIYDDCLDLVGSEEQAGKTLGTDFQKGKFTLPVLIALHSRDASLREEVGALLVRQDETDYTDLAALLVSGGGLSAALATGQRLLDEALESISCVPVNRYGAGLQALAAYVGSLLRGLARE